MNQLSNKKKIILVGGSGVIGTILAEGLSSIYRVLIADRKPPANVLTEYIQLDAVHYDELEDKLPKDASAIINLIATSPQENVVEPQMMSEMVDVYVKGAYNIYEVATQLRIPRVVFTSSNHVTDYYENEGFSSLGREITSMDYPLTKSVYGALKLTAESLGHVYFVNRGLSVICLRIGTVRMDEKKALESNHRIHRTLLSREDTINLFEAALETKNNYGVYYGVSNNFNKPWSISNAIKELGYQPRRNTKDLMNLGE